MLFTLSSGSPWKCTYSNESGQALFKAAPYDSLDFGDNITISRFVKYASRDALQPIGEFHSNPFQTTRIAYMGDDQPVKQFFRKKEMIFEKHRVFSGPDGREYIWMVYPRACKLFLDDKSETAVATFQCKKRESLFSPKSPASVEIFPPGEHMVELILVTLLYMEKLRQEIELEEAVEVVAEVVAGVAEVVVGM